MHNKVDVYFSKLLLKNYTIFTKKFFNVLDAYHINYELIQNTKDIWMRDYMPIIRKDRKFIRYIHNPDYLKGYKSIRTEPKQATKFLDKRDIIDIPLNLDGGNMIYHASKLICTDKIYRENKSYSKDEVNEILKKSLLLTDLIVIPEIPFDMTGHADGIVRFIDEHKVLVAPLLEEDKEVENKMLQALKDANLEIIMLPKNAIYYDKDGGWASQINYLKTDSLLLVPIVHNVSDEVRTVFKTQFPECTIEYLDCYDIIQEGGALNCISWN